MSGAGRFLLAPLLWLLLALPVAAVNLPDNAHTPMLEGAHEFLRLLDQHRPDEAWVVTTSYFRKQLDKPAWRQHYQQQRAPLGPPLARRLDSYRFRSTFADATDGLYLEVRFLSDFRARAAVQERVVMYKDYDGRWRVIGYFLEFN